MKILAVESSCDETAVAVVEDGRTVLTDCIASQVALHRLYGGVVPELASRKHIEAIYALADEALSRASMTRQEIDAIAVTYAPGLIGAVLVGVNFAKAAAYSLGVPLVPVHHIRGHIAANYLAYPDLEPPFLCLVVSGGHTLIVDVQDYTKFHIMGTTRDDAAGECFDKIARVIGMPYPGGAALDKAAQTGDETKYPMPHTKLSGNPLDMSFSGLKTAALNLIHTHEQRGEALDIPSLCASFSKAVSDMLVPRTMQALKETGYKTLAIAGGVAANSRIRGEFTRETQRLGVRLCMPPLSLCGDNGAMIGAQGYYEYLAGKRAGQDLNAYSNQICSSRLAFPPRMAALSSSERGSARMCCSSACGSAHGLSVPNRIRSAPNVRTRFTNASSESHWGSPSSASAGRSEKAVSSRAVVSASSSGTASQQRQPPICASTSVTGPTS